MACVYFTINNLISKHSKLIRFKRTVLEFKLKDDIINNDAWISKRYSSALTIQWKWKHKYSDTTVSIKDEAMDGKFTYAKMLDNDIIERKGLSSPSNSEIESIWLMIAKNKVSLFKSL